MDDQLNQAPLQDGQNSGDQQNITFDTPTSPPNNSTPILTQNAEISGINSNQNIGPVNDNAILKTPLIVIIIAWFMLLGGIGQILINIFLMMLNPILGAPLLLLAILLVVTSFGIRHMRRWSLLVYTAVASLSIAGNMYYVLTSKVNADKIVNSVSTIFLIIVLGYFWKINKRFT